MAGKFGKMIYYEIGPTRSDRGDGWGLMNRDRLQSDGGWLKLKNAWPDGRGVLPREPWTLPDYLEPPHFVFDRRLGRPPHDFGMRDGLFLISAKMKSLLEELAPDAWDYRPCSTSYRNGQPAPELWIGSVVRAFKEAVDLENSNIKFRLTAYISLRCIRKRWNWLSSRKSSVPRIAFAFGDIQSLLSATIISESVAKKLDCEGFPSKEFERSATRIGGVSAPVRNRARYISSSALCDDNSNTYATLFGPRFTKNRVGNL
ncbi:hypothetical protein AMC82_CH02401 [Rhizobium phaseoli]|nr:DUF1629 domain-containing protein [Rhizobium phaseoli]ANL66041.1 hypothetical protein AMC84_CH02409 [Rhizobium phaseoli]ANL78854.1 hypothetical protein AMC82_CH02401 [Rhizobium phaseoli]